MLRPVKISERLPDTYVLASRGYSLNEIDDANKAFKQMQCQIEISQEEMGGTSGVTLFRTE